MEKLKAKWTLEDVEIGSILIKDDDREKYDRVIGIINDKIIHTINEKGIEFSGQDYYYRNLNYKLLVDESIGKPYNENDLNLIQEEFNSVKKEIENMTNHELISKIVKEVIARFSKDLMTFKEEVDGKLQRFEKQIEEHRHEALNILREQGNIIRVLDNKVFDSKEIKTSEINQDSAFKFLDCDKYINEKKLAELSNSKHYDLELLKFKLEYLKELNRTFVLHTNTELIVPVERSEFIRDVVNKTHELIKEISELQK